MPVIPAIVTTFQEGEIIDPPVFKVLLLYVMIMSSIDGAKKAEIQSLPQIKDRISFVYLEHCKLNRQDGAITVTDIRGTVHIPASSLGVLILGPGTNISHRAIELIGNSGTSIIWVGENGVRYYAHGSPITRSAHLLIKQAQLVSNTRSRIAVARKMYQIRFPFEDVSNLTMQQLRGREGARVRTVYRNASRNTGVVWSGREYDPKNFNASDPVNKALSAAHSCLYGIVHSVIVAIGCSPGLGFVHTGHERSFVYDIADLYKATLSIPTAFEIAAENPPDIGAAVRRKIRDKLSDGHILEQSVRDIRSLLLDSEAEEHELEMSKVYLWDNLIGVVPSALSYGKEFDFEDEDQLKEGYGKVLMDQL